MVASLEIHLMGIETCVGFVYQSAIEAFLTAA